MIYPYTDDIICQRQGNNRQYVNYKHKSNLFSSALAYIKLQLQISIAIIRLNKKIDYCLFFLEPGLIIPFATARIMHKKILWLMPSSFEKVKELKHKRDLGYSIMLYLYFICLSLVTKIIVYSPHLIKDWSLERYEKKVIIAHRHFPDLNIFKIQNSYVLRDNIIGYIGRFSEEKGILNFIHAVPRLLKDNINYSILIIGDGNLRDEIEALLADININTKKRIILMKWVEHEKLATYLNKIKLLVMPSVTEGLPNIALEAMACGTPVLATAVGAIPDIIVNEENGFILDNTAPDCIISGINRALTFPNIVDVIYNARLLIENEFTLRNVITKWKNIIG
jgi:glycosyltransferase involved in cell wall biosynthesis